MKAADLDPEGGYYIAAIAAAPGSIRVTWIYVLVTPITCVSPVQEVMIPGEAGRQPLDVVKNWGPKLPAPTDRRWLERDEDA